MNDLSCDVADSVDENWWNNLVKQADCGSVFQTTHWANYFCGYTGAKPTYLVFRDSSSVLGLLVIFETDLQVRDIFISANRAWYSKCLDTLNLKNYYWLNGPVILEKEAEVHLIKSMVQTLDELAKARNIFKIKDVTLAHNHNSMGILETNKFSYFRWGTYLTDLTPSLDVLWSNLEAKSAARTKVRSAQKKGATVRLAESKSDLRKYHEIICEHRRMNNLALPSFRRYELLWDNLRKEDNVQVFFVEHNGKVIAGQGVYVFNGRLSLFTPVQSAYCYKNNIYAGDLIQWEVIKWGHANNHNIRDLVGVAPNPQTQKEINIRKFKEKWGGRYEEYSVYSKTYRPYLAKAIGFGLKARNIAKKLGRNNNGTT